VATLVHPPEKIYGLVAHILTQTAGWKRKGRLIINAALGKQCREQARAHRSLNKRVRFAQDPHGTVCTERERERGRFAMFKQLVESGSHRADLARRGSFFVGTLACYLLLLVTTGVASVYTYNAQLDNQNLELVALVTPAPLPAQPQADTPHAASAPQRANIIERTALIDRLDSGLKPPDTVSVKPNNVPEMPKYGTVLLSNRNSGDAIGGGPVSVPGTDRVGTTGQPRVVTDEGPDVAPPVKAAPTPTPAPKQIALPSSIISSKAIYKPVPVYPVIAKQAHAFGVVTVEILVDEQGRVVSAQATSGHPLLREAARQAALQARFTPTQLNGQPVKVSGVINYNFVLQ
jgi:protein TonB